MVFDPVSLTLGMGLSMLSYAENAKAAKAAAAFQQKMFAANSKNIWSAYGNQITNIHANRERSQLERAANQRANAERAMAALGQTTVTQAARGVGGQSMRDAKRDIEATEVRNKVAIERRHQMDMAAFDRSLEAALLEANSKILQATPGPTQDPSLLNALIGGITLGATIGSFGS